MIRPYTFEVKNKDQKIIVEAESANHYFCFDAESGSILTALPAPVAQEIKVKLEEHLFMLEAVQGWAES